MFDKLKFRAAIVGKGKTMKDVAIAIGVSESTLYRKVNGVSQFSREEIQTICRYLKLDSPIEIFFA